MENNKGNWEEEREKLIKELEEKDRIVEEMKKTTEEIKKGMEERKRLEKKFNTMRYIIGAILVTSIIIVIACIKPKLAIATAILIIATLYVWIKY